MSRLRMPHRWASDPTHNICNRSYWRMEPDSIEIEHALNGAPLASMFWQMWFDVDRYFGSNTHDHDDTWLNFLTVFDGETITAVVIVDQPHRSDYFEWALTEEEERFFLSLICEELKKARAELAKELGVER